MPLTEKEKTITDIKKSEINSPRCTNETIEILLTKVTELEKRISDLERTANHRNIDTI